MSQGEAVSLSSSEFDNSGRCKLILNDTADVVMVHQVLVIDVQREHLTLGSSEIILS